MKPGYYWARGEGLNGGLSDWELVELRHSTKDITTLEVFSMGWDIPSPVSDYTDYVKVNLIDPDGNKLLGVDERRM